MSENVDVLAVIDRAFCYAQNNCVYDDVRELDAARAAVAELIEAASLLVAQIELHGDMDDGCFYYNGRSASELQTPLHDACAALARAKGGAE